MSRSLISTPAARAPACQGSVRGARLLGALRGAQGRPFYASPGLARHTTTDEIRAVLARQLKLEMPLHCRGLITCDAVTGDSGTVCELGPSTSAPAAGRVRSNRARRWTQYGWWRLRAPG